MRPGRPAIIGRMAFPLEGTAITHSIQLAVAPVFLLTAVSGMIGAVAHRLGRIIDRARLVEERSRHAHEAADLQRAEWELGQLRLRGHLADPPPHHLVLYALGRRERETRRAKLVKCSAAGRRRLMPCRTIPKRS